MACQNQAKRAFFIIFASSFSKRAKAIPILDHLKGILHDSLTRLP